MSGRVRDLDQESMTSLTRVKEFDKTQSKVKLHMRVKNLYSICLFQMTFASDEVLPPELSNNFTFGETTYTLYTNSFLNFGQVSYLYRLILLFCIIL